jgi:molybdenum cofactor guanylyltransferase
MLERIVALLRRTCEPVVVVRAASQELPALPVGVLVAVDAREARGPLEGIAAGLRAIGGSAGSAYISSADAPLLHPAFVAAVARALGDAEMALPHLDGRTHPLAGCYRTSVLPAVQALLDAGQLRLSAFYEGRDVRLLRAHDLLADGAVARLDPRLDSLRNLNTPEDYQRALAEPEPAVHVSLRGAAGAADGAALTVRAATVGRALDALALGERRAHATVALNGAEAGATDATPLVAGDALSVIDAGATASGA